MRPRLLDLFCKAGGASMGYHLAGFEVVGVDIEPQPRYPFEFHQADALTFPLGGFDVIAASPPCQAHSRMRRIKRNQRIQRPDLVAPIRERLQAAGVPYIIENVPGAPLVEPIMLCGLQFGLRVYRHRLFESNVFMLSPPHQRHRHKAAYPAPGVVIYSSTSHCKTLGPAMGINWMNRDEIEQAIPPAYTEFIGRQLLQ